MIGDSFPALLAQARRRDQRAWDAIYRDLAGPLAGYFRSHGIRDADDAVGETFLHVARSLPRFAGDETQFRAWVFTIAHRRRVDLVRNATRRPNTPIDPDAMTALVDAATGEDNALDQLVDQLHRNGTIDALMQQLTAEQAEVLVLRFGADLDATTVGQMTGRSTNAVAAITARALRRLREVIDASPVDTDGR